LRPDGVKATVKLEPVFEGDKGRGIQAYWNLHTQALFAPHIAAIQKAAGCYRLDCGRGVRLTMASGMNNIDIGRWMTDCTRDGARFFQERDCSAFDACMQLEHLRLKLSIYSVGGEALCRFMESCAIVTGVFRKRGAYIKYRVNYTVKSGQNDTSIGNGIVNAAITVQSMWACGLSGDVIIAGDDLLIALPHDFDEHALADEERRYGVIPKYRKFYCPFACTFISGCFYPGVDGSFLFGPMLGRQCGKLFWTVSDVPDRKRVEFASGVAAGLYPCCAGLPILGVMLSTQMRDHKRIILKHGYSLVKQEFSPDILSFVCHKYGITPGDVREIEQLYVVNQGRSSVIRHPALDHVISHDLRKIGERSYFLF
jgi:hypothetical protein